MLVPLLKISTGGAIPVSSGITATASQAAFASTASDNLFIGLFEALLTRIPLDAYVQMREYANKAISYIPDSVISQAQTIGKTAVDTVSPALSEVQKRLRLSNIGPTFEYWLAEAEDYTTLYPRTALYIALGCFTLFLLFTVWPMICGKKRRSKVPDGDDAETYLIDFATYKPPPRLYVHKEGWAKQNRHFKWSQEDLDFQFKLLDRSGLGDTTAFPDSLLADPPNISIATAREEAEVVMFGVLDELFARNKLDPKDVDILIVNCSLFNPTPSLSAMIINRYGMRQNVMSYNLSGMGCSAGLISIALARDLLQVHKEANVVIVSTENITQNIYLGREKAMLISNTLFRMGGAGLYLSNRRSVRKRARWQLEHVVRTHLGADNKSYRCVFQELDSDGKLGVRLDRELMKVAEKALRSNIEEMGPKILPLTEKLLYVARFIVFKLRTMFSKKEKKKSQEAQSTTDSPKSSKEQTSSTKSDSTVESAAEATKAARARAEKAKRITPPIPNFTKAVDYFCIHAGGRAVIDALEQSLSLPEKYVIPSREALRRHGNTSSASIWYELEYIENNESPKRGEKVWQIAFGSGFKCNSAVWKRL